MSEEIMKLTNTLIERFSYDLEMKTREQNRNNKQTEIERFDWFIERIQTRMAFGWLSKRSGEKTSCPKNSLEINRYFALTSYCNTIGQSNNAFSILGFLIKVAEYVTKEWPSLRPWHVVERAHAIRKFSTTRVQQTAHQVFQFSERIEEPNQGCND